MNEIFTEIQGSSVVFAGSKAFITKQFMKHVKYTFLLKIMGLLNPFSAELLRNTYISSFVQISEWGHT
jgi:hypothetical protein